jgi:hypothetical protein
VEQAKEDESLYTKLYSDIIDGYSSFFHNDEEVFIKHVSQTDFGYLEQFEDNEKNKAIEKGLPTEKEKLKDLIDQSLWTQKQEDLINILKKEIEDKEIIISKLVIARQIQHTRKQKEALEKDLLELVSEREELIGYTAEKYSGKKSNLEILRFTLFKDKQFKELLFDNETFDLMDDSELNTLLLSNNSILNDFTQRNLKKIAATGFFLNAFLIAESNVMNFYGKPVVRLTNYQIDIFNHGLKYKNVLEKGKTPPSVLTSLDEIVDWYEGQASGKTEYSENTKNKTGQTLVGASKHEMETMMESARGNKEEEAVTLNDEVKKMQKGRENKVLDFNDMLKIHGEI